MKIRFHAAFFFAVRELRVDVVCTLAHDGGARGVV